MRSRSFTPCDRSHEGGLVGSDTCLLINGGPFAVCLPSKQVCGWHGKRGQQPRQEPLGGPGTCWWNSALCSNNTISEILSPKLLHLSILLAICQCINIVLMGRTQQMRMRNTASFTCTMSTRVPQGCVLLPLLFFPYTNDCVWRHPTCGSESACAQEVEWLELCFSRVKRELKMFRTIEVTVDFRKPQLALRLSNCPVSIVATFKFLGITSGPQVGNQQQSILKKAQQRTHSLWPPLLACHKSC
ncbi:uncharacterized protein LOC133501080 [Syngnathoides biaculeatus]|uniref:uncharacterized protein LOC133501080 n=1 Tax=Syngnathoides biaculeatus TaxID=300417 RepID=UPI002ADD7242|nr:uncharacterized protein LOC133501080 [Syngnathoides biaculeatus]